jgi:hypothetical protein
MRSTAQPELREFALARGQVKRDEARRTNQPLAFLEDRRISGNEYPIPWFIHTTGAVVVPGCLRVVTNNY